MCAWHAAGVGTGTCMQAGGQLVEKLILPFLYGLCGQSLG